MALPPLNVDHAAFAGLLAESLRITFDALAYMYERKDGPWVDELRQAAVNGDAETREEARQVLALFDGFRKELEPRSQVQT